MSPRIIAQACLVVSAIGVVPAFPRPVGTTRTSIVVSPKKECCVSHFGVPQQLEDDWALPYQGAGLPRPELFPGEIPELLMHALEFNDIPHPDAGLEAVWAFAGPTTRHMFQDNMTEFVESAHETADTMPTSFYGAAMNGQSWSMETQVNRVGGVEGYIATQVMKTVSSDGRVRRWQWELRRNRRPPYLNCWFVESIGSSNRKGNFEAD